MNTPSKYRFFYLREKSQSNNIKGFPVACIALNVDRNRNTVNYGLATVHPDDKKSFTKAHARELAVGRLEYRNVSLSLPKGQYQNMSDVIRMILSDLNAQSSTPIRTKKAISRWFKQYENAPPPSSNTTFGLINGQYKSLHSGPPKTIKVMNSNDSED